MLEHPAAKYQYVADIPLSEPPYTKQFADADLLRSQRLAYRYVAGQLLLNPPPANYQAVAVTQPVAQYRPVADDLLSKHKLTVDDSTRDMLAEFIMHARKNAATNGAYSPAPIAEKALGQTHKLRRYLDQPPTRKSSLPNWRGKLHETIGKDWHLYFHLAVEMGAGRIAGIVDALESGTIDADSLDALIEALDATIRKDWKGVGRPGSIAKKAVRTGCIVWIRAGHPEWSYTWNNYSERPEGALADFLRDLMASCGRVVSGSTLRSHVDECRKDGMLEHLSKNA